MSYSDYGSYNWKKEKEKWVYKLEFEDTNLLSQITGEGISKETLNILGVPLKIGAVADSMELEKKYPGLPFEIIHTHHSVIGDLKGYAVISFKGHPKVLYKGKVIYEFEEKDIYKKNYDFKKIKVIHLREDNCEVKLTIDTSENFWSVAYIRNGEDEYLSICGYGLGEHWWLNDEGKEISGDDDSDERECFDGDMNPIPNPHYRWPREKECLQKALKTLNIN
jgi:hypothetical protein